MKPTKSSPEAIVREIKRRTRRHFGAEEKIRIVLEGLRGEASIAELCRKAGIQLAMYYKWSKEFLDAGKKRLQGDIVREATTNEVTTPRDEDDQLKTLVAELSLRTRVLKKACVAWGSIRTSHETHGIGEIGDQ